MRKRIKNLRTTILITLGWSTTVASIVLQAVYQRPLLTSFEITLLFTISALTGMILIDPEAIISSYAGTLFLSVFIMFACLTLPPTMDATTPLTMLQHLYAGALTIIFRSIFPTVIMACLIGAITGGIIGEKIIKP